MSVGVSMSVQMIVTGMGNEKEFLYGLTAKHILKKSTHIAMFWSILLYQSSGQDSRDLNEPYSNIKGGLGMFTAFNSDTASVYLVKKENSN